MNEVIFDLPKAATRVWDLPVPVVVDNYNKTISMYITGTIEEPFLYNEVCHMLRTADEYMTINVYINTPGGIIDSAFMIANAIEESKANVVGYLSGTVASAGTIISMACRSIVPAPHLSFMIHNYSGGIAGKGHEMKARQKFTDDHLSAAFTEFYSGFLSQEEMQSVIEGTDLWMGTDEVNARWSKRVSYVKGEVNE